MVSDRIFDDGTTAAAAAEDAELQAAIDAFIPPRGASTATDDTLWGTAEKWQRHYDDTPYPPDHPGSEERIAAGERYAAEEFARLQRGWLAAAAAAANDPSLLLKKPPRLLPAIRRKSIYASLIVGRFTEHICSRRATVFCG